MCIIVYLPAGAGMDRETLQTCWDANPDGAGYMFSQDGKLIIRKGFMDFEKFWRSFEKADRTAGAETNFVLHFRIASHGKVNLENCHPHRIRKGLAIAHNGIIDCMDAKPKGKDSDTVLYVRKILKNLPDGFLRSKGIRQLIRLTIDWSKLAFMDATGRVTLIGEETGVWDDGAWFSNDSYLPRKVFMGWKWSDQDYLDALEKYEGGEDVGCLHCDAPLYAGEFERGICWDCWADVCEAEVAPEDTGEEVEIIGP